MVILCRGGIRSRPRCVGALSGHREECAARSGVAVRHQTPDCWRVRWPATAARLLFRFASSVPSTCWAIGCPHWRQSPGASSNGTVTDRWRCRHGGLHAGAAAVRCARLVGSTGALPSRTWDLMGISSARHSLRSSERWGRSARGRRDGAAGRWARSGVRSDRRLRAASRRDRPDCEPSDRQDRGAGRVVGHLARRGWPWSGGYGRGAVA